MIKYLISDFSRVLFFPKDKTYTGGLNSLHREMSQKPGYKILDYFELNSELINYYKSLSPKFGLYIFTSETIQDSPELVPFIEPVFREVFSAMKLGIDKKDPNSYLEIISKVDASASEVIYVDDNLGNIDAANKAGLQAILYSNNKSLISELQTKLVS